MDVGPLKASPHTPVLAQVCPQRVTPCFRTLGLFSGIIIFVVPKLPEDSLYFVRGSFVAAAWVAHGEWESESQRFVGANSLGAREGRGRAAGALGAITFGSAWEPPSGCADGGGAPDAPTQPAALLQRPRVDPMWADLGLEEMPSEISSSGASMACSDECSDLEGAWGSEMDTMSSGSGETDSTSGSSGSDTGSYQLG